MFKVSKNHWLLHFWDKKIQSVGQFCPPPLDSNRDNGQILQIQFLAYMWTVHMLLINRFVVLKIQNVYATIHLWFSMISVVWWAYRNFMMYFLTGIEYFLSGGSSHNFVFIAMIDSNFLCGPVRLLNQIRFVL